jgi:integrase
MGRVGGWLDTYKSPNTIRNFKGALRHFFETVYGSATLDLETLDKQAETYFTQKRDYGKDVQTFLNTIEDQAPKTVRLKVSAVRIFLSENDVELKTKFWKRVRRKVKGSRARTIDRAPTPKELRRIINHLPIQGKALSLMLESSGMRIGEALQLRADEMELNRKPCAIRLRGEITKSGEPRLTFISREAVEVLEEWLNVREQYLEFACQKSNLHHKEPDDPRLFPFKDTTAYYLWNKALEKAKLMERDPSTNRATIHFHVLRKVFRSQLGLVIPIDIVEALMGHEGYLQDVYKRYPDPDKELAKQYVKGEHALLVYTESAEVSKLKVEIEKGKEELQILVNTLTSKSIRLEEENKDLKRRIQRTEEKLSEIEKLIEDKISKL